MEITKGLQDLWENLCMRAIEPHITTIAQATGKNKTDIRNLYKSELTKLTDLLMEQGSISIVADVSIATHMFMSLVNNNVLRALGINVDLGLPVFPLGELFNEAWLEQLPNEALRSIQGSAVGTKPVVAEPVVAGPPQKELGLKERLVLIATEIGMQEADARQLVDVFIHGDEIPSDEALKVIENTIKRVAATYAPIPDTVPWSSFVDTATAFLTGIGYTDVQSRQIIQAIRAESGVGDFIPASVYDDLFSALSAKARGVKEAPSGLHILDVETSFRSILSDAGIAAAEIDRAWAAASSGLPERITQSQVDAVIAEANKRAASQARRPDLYRVTDLASWERWIVEKVQKEIRSLEATLGKDFTLAEEQKIIEAAQPAGEDSVRRLQEQGLAFTSITAAQTRVGLDVSDAVKRTGMAIIQEGIQIAARLQYKALSDDFWAKTGSRLRSQAAQRGVPAAEVVDKLSEFQDAFAKAALTVIRDLSILKDPALLAQEAFNTGMAAVSAELSKYQRRLEGEEPRDQITSSGIARHASIIERVLQLQGAHIIDPLIQSRGLKKDVIYARLHDAIIEQAQQKIGTLIAGNERDAYWDIFSAALFKVLSARQEEILK